MDQNIGCLLLAGGKGKRMGQTDKLNVIYKGETFGDIIAAKLKKTGLKCFLSIAHYNHESFHDFIIVKDQKFNDEYIGPLGGIYSGLLACQKEGLKGLFIVSCDTPHFDHQLFEVIEQYIYNYSVVVFETGDHRVHYTIGYYSVDCLDAIKENIDSHQYRLSLLSKQCPTLVLKTKDLNIKDELFNNYNDLEALKDLKKADNE